MDDLDARIAEKLKVRPYRIYKPLVDAIDGYVQWARTPEERVYLGIPELDAAMRGTARGELTMIVGFAQSAKTVLTTNLLLNHHDKNILFVTPDETRELMLVKLTCALHRVSAEDLEAGLQRGDDVAHGQLTDTARKYARLAVVDDVSTLEGMDVALDEAMDAWNHQEADLVIFDYLDLLEGSGEEANARASAIKAWGKRRHVPLYVLHQSSRTSGKDGASVTMTSATHGGERQAIHMIGVRRKKYELEAQIAELQAKLRSPTISEASRCNLELILPELEYSLQLHQGTVTVNLVKNKRPPARLVDEIDYELEESTGRLLPLGRGELTRAFRESQRATYSAKVDQRHLPIEGDIDGLLDEGRLDDGWQ